MEEKKLCSHGNEALYINLLEKGKSNPFVSTCCQLNYDQKYLYFIQNFQNGSFDSDETKVLVTCLNEKKKIQSNFYDKMVGSINEFIEQLKNRINYIEQLKEKELMDDETLDNLSEMKQCCEYFFSNWKNKPNESTFKAYKNSIKNYLKVHIQLQEKRSEFEFDYKNFKENYNEFTKSIKKISENSLKELDYSLMESKDDDSKYRIGTNPTKIRNILLFNEWTGLNYNFDILSKENIMVKTSMIKNSDSICTPMIETFNLKTNLFIEKFEIYKNGEYSGNSKSFSNYQRIFCIEVKSFENRLIYFQLEQGWRNAYIYSFDKKSKLLKEHKKIDLGVDMIWNFNYSTKHNQMVFLFDSGYGVKFVDQNSLQIKFELKEFEGPAYDSCFYNDDFIIIGEDKKYHLYNFNSNKNKTFTKKTSYPPNSMEMNKIDNKLVTGDRNGNVRIYKFNLDRIHFLSEQRKINMNSNNRISRIEILKRNFIIISNSNSFLSIINMETGEIEKKEIINAKEIVDFKIDPITKVMVLKDECCKENTRYYIMNE